MGSTLLEYKVNPKEQLAENYANLGMVWSVFLKNLRKLEM